VSCQRQLILQCLAPLFRATISWSVPFPAGLYDGFNCLAVGRKAIFSLCLLDETSESIASLRCPRYSAALIGKDYSPQFPCLNLSAVLATTRNPGTWSIARASARLKKSSLSVIL
jgi:hypothetical protein